MKAEEYNKVVDAMDKAEESVTPYAMDVFQLSVLTFLLTSRHQILYLLIKYGNILPRQVIVSPLFSRVFEKMPYLCGFAENGFILFDFHHPLTLCVEGDKRHVPVAQPDRATAF